MKTARFGALALLTVLLVGCGDAEQQPVSQGPAATPVAGETAVSQSAPTKKAPAAELPSEPEIRREQAAKEGPRAAAAKALQSDAERRSRRVSVDESTAPAPALSLAERAARQWLRFKLDGVKPSLNDVAELAEGVATADPRERAKGRAVMTTFRAFAANPNGKGWSIQVATDDARLATVLVQVDKRAGQLQISAIGAN